MRTIKKLLFTLLPLICAASNPMVHAFPKINLQKKETKSHIKKIAFAGGTTISISIACFILYIINRKNTNSSQPIQPEKESKEDDKALMQQESAIVQQKKIIKATSPQFTIDEKKQGYLDYIRKVYEKAQKINIPDETKDTIIALNWIYKRSPSLFNELKEVKPSDEPESLRWYTWHKQFNILALCSPDNKEVFYTLNFLIRRINKKKKIKGFIFFLKEEDFPSADFQKSDIIDNAMFSILKKNFTGKDFLFLPSQISFSQREISVKLHEYCERKLLNNENKPEQSSSSKKLLKEMKDQLEDDLRNRLDKKTETEIKNQLKSKNPQLSGNSLEKKYIKYLVQQLLSKKGNIFRKLNKRSPQVTDEFYEQKRKDQSEKSINYLLPNHVHQEMISMFESFIEYLENVKEEEKEKIVAQAVEKYPETYKTFLMLYEESGISSLRVNRFREYYNNIKETQSQ